VVAAGFGRYDSVASTRVVVASQGCSVPNECKNGSIMALRGLNGQVYRAKVCWIMLTWVH